MMATTLSYHAGCKRPRQASTDEGTDRVCSPTGGYISVENVHAILQEVRYEAYTHHIVDSDKKLACPFPKHDPDDYVRGQGQGTCTRDPGFKDIGTLNEHIKRVHSRTWKCCPDCGRSFVNTSKKKLEAEKRTHVCPSNSSSITETPEEEGLKGVKMDLEQDRRFMKLDFRGKDISQRQAWELVYLSLWPDESDSIPSPYYEPFTIPIHRYDAVVARIKSNLGSRVVQLSPSIAGHNRDSNDIMDLDQRTPPSPSRAFDIGAAAAAAAATVAPSDEPPKTLDEVLDGVHEPFNHAPDTNGPDSGFDEPYYPDDSENNKNREISDAPVADALYLDYECIDPQCLMQNDGGGCLVSDAHRKMLQPSPSSREQEEDAATLNHMTSSFGSWSDNITFHPRSDSNSFEDDLYDESGPCQGRYHQ